MKCMQMYVPVALRLLVHPLAITMNFAPWSWTMQACNHASHVLLLMFDLNANARCLMGERSRAPFFLIVKPNFLGDALITAGAVRIIPCLPVAFDADMDLTGTFGLPGGDMVAVADPAEKGPDNLLEGGISIGTPGHTELPSNFGTGGAPAGTVAFGMPLKRRGCPCNQLMCGLTLTYLNKQIRIIFHV